MRRITKIKLLSLAKILSVVFLVLGIFNGLFYLIILPWIRTGKFVGFESSPGIFLFLFLIFPLTFAVIGFVTGILLALVYNFAARRFGGVEIEFD